MDASTTIPIENAKPANDITFIERPNPAIATKVPITETGMAIKIIPVGINDLKNKTENITENEGVIYAGNPKILKRICPGVFGTIKPVGYCMIGKR